MSQVTAELIEGKSWTLRVFEDGDEPGKVPYIALLRLDDKGNKVCEIAATMGELSEEINVAIALKAMELGFKVLKFSTLKDQKVTRWATLESSDDTYKHWFVDLDKAFMQYVTSHVVL
jgi:hypothetical protein